MFQLYGRIALLVNDLECTVTLDANRPCPEPLVSAGMLSGWREYNRLHDKRRR